MVEKSKALWPSSIFKDPKKCKLIDLITSLLNFNAYLALKPIRNQLGDMLKPLKFDLSARKLDVSTSMRSKYIDFKQ